MKITTQEQVAANAASKGANGICYDTEGWVTKENANTMAAQYKSKYPVQIVCPPGDPGAAFANPGNFTHVAPMLYWGETSYQGKITIPWIDQAIAGWESAGWSKSQIILTFQSQSAAIAPGPTVLAHLKGLLSQGYAGLIGWPSVNTADDAKAIQMIMS